GHFYLGLGNFRLDVSIFIKKVQTKSFGCRMQGSVRHGCSKIEIFYGFNFQPESRSEEHTSELQSRENLVCRLLLEKKKNNLTEKDFEKSIRRMVLMGGSSNAGLHLSPIVN